MQNEDIVCMLQMFIFFFFKIHDEDETETSNGRGWRLGFARFKVERLGLPARRR